jgi:hypothetical protein
LATVPNPKSSSGLYGPLNRFLQSRVGQKWDSIWSEICENSKDKLGSVLRKRIKYIIAFNCVYGKTKDEIIVEGQLNHSCPFYIDPGLKILLKSKLRPKYHPSAPKQKIYEMDGLEYFCHDDIWYRIKTADYVKDPGNHYEADIEDVFGSHPVDKLRRIYGSKKQVIWKQQANSKECDKLKELTNGTTD